MNDLLLAIAAAAPFVAVAILLSNDIGRWLRGEPTEIGAA